MLENGGNLFCDSFEGWQLQDSHPDALMYNKSNCKWNIAREISLVPGRTESYGITPISHAANPVVTKYDGGGYATGCVAYAIKQPSITLQSDTLNLHSEDLYTWKRQRGVVLSSFAPAGQVTTVPGLCSLQAVITTTQNGGLVMSVSPYWRQWIHTPPLGYIKLDEWQHIAINYSIDFDKVGSTVVCRFSCTGYINGEEVDSYTSSEIEGYWGYDSTSFNRLKQFTNLSLFGNVLDDTKTVYLNLFQIPSVLAVIDDFYYATEYRGDCIIETPRPNEDITPNWDNSYSPPDYTVLRTSNIDYSKFIYTNIKEAEILGYDDLQYLEEITEILGVQSNFLTMKDGSDTPRIQGYWITPIARKGNQWVSKGDYKHQLYGQLTQFTDDALSWTPEAINGLTGGPENAT